MLVHNQDCQGVHLQEVLVIHRRKCLDFIRLVCMDNVHDKENYILKGNCTKDCIDYRL